MSTDQDADADLTRHPSGHLSGHQPRKSSARLAPAVAREIAALAEQAGWSCTELARRAHLPAQSVSRKIRECAALDVAELEALAEALGVNPVQIIIDAQSRSRAPQ